MKVRVSQNHLLSRLQMAQNIVEKKTTIPILSHILLESMQSRLKLSSTDLEVGVTDICDANTLEEGSTTVQARKFLEIIRELPETEIELEQKDEHLEIRTGRSVFRLRSLAPEEFPKIPVVQSKDSVHLKGDFLQRMIQNVSISISSDEGRYTLTGVLMQMEEKDGHCMFRMVSTDGHRLSYCERVLDGVRCAPWFVEGSKNETRDIILPRKAVHEMRRLTEDGEDIEFGVSHENAFVQKGDFSMIMRLVQGKFPDFKAVIPREVIKRLTINSTSLEESLRRVSLLSTEKARVARFAVERGKIVISSISPEIGDAEEELDAQYDGDPFELSFNIRYLLDYLQLVKGDVDLEFGEDLRPCLIRNRKDDSHYYVVMPLRT